MAMKLTSESQVQGDCPSELSFPARDGTLTKHHGVLPAPFFFFLLKQ